MKIDNHEIAITNPDKILFPKSKITKMALIEYYQAIAPIMLPYLKDRPLMMHRFPAGIADEGFYQKDVGDYFPDWIKRTTVPKREGGHNTYVVCNNAATLVYLANQACITPHIWLSRLDALDNPDRMIFDLDPGDGANGFAVVRQTALLLRDILDGLDLASFAMTTGSRGMHVVVPLKRVAPFDHVRACALAIATYAVQQNDKHLTVQHTIAKRQGRLYIDTNRNAFAQTAVAPFAVRALEHAPVAMPVLWDMVQSSTLQAQSYTIANAHNHLKAHTDPWAHFTQKAHTLGKAHQAIEKMLAK